MKKKKTKKISTKKASSASSFLKTLPIKNIFLFTSLFVAILAILFLWGKSEAPKKELYVDTVIQSTPQPRVTREYPTPTQIVGYIEKDDFKARQFDPTQLFVDYSGTKIKYPSELTDFSETSLTQLSCSKVYVSEIGSEKFFTYQDEGKNFLLTDQKLLGYIAFLNKKYAPKRVLNISSCETKEGKTFVLYGISVGGGGDYWGKPHIGIDTGNGITEEMVGPTVGACMPLELFNGEFMYIKCSAHEGGGGYDMIFQVNLSNKSYSKLLECSTEGAKATCK